MCSLVERYQRFGRICYFYLRGEVILRKSCLPANHRTSYKPIGKPQPYFSLVENNELEVCTYESPFNLLPHLSGHAVAQLVGALH